MKKLNELVDSKLDIEITGITTDSRNVEKGNLFICTHGLYCNRHDFIDSAIEKGAVAAIVDQEKQVNIPTVKVKNTNDSLLEICEKFYDNPCEHLNMVATTGTDGKTTTATMIWQLLKKNNNPSYIGTNGIEINDEHFTTSNTTPLPEKLYAYLDKMVKEKSDVVSMEVSSEALLHERVNRIGFDVAILTNITEDHLNIHHTLENYVKAKGKLFTLVKDDGICILNCDDPHYQDILKYCENKKIYTYGKDVKSDFIIQDIIEKETTKFTILHKEEKIEFESPYLGIYNVWNLTAALITCHEKFGYSWKELQEQVKLMEPIKGRNEKLTFGQDYHIILDYAHTENAIKEVLTMLRKVYKGKIITVTGSAGGREKEKRQGMGKVALEKSDLVIFTMDDPRCENVEDIIDDLISGSTNTNYLKIIDRKEAIYKAFSLAKKGDVVAVLGKGRDNYMAIGKEYIPYSDYEVIEDYFNK